MKYHKTRHNQSFLYASLAGERCIGWRLSLSLSIEVDPSGSLDTELSSYLCLAVPMHQRFSLNATSGSKLSNVDQFTFNNQQICWRHIFYEQTVCADAQLNATVCHFADIISLRRRHNSLGPIRAIGEYLIDLKFYLNKIFDLKFTYEGIRVLNIPNLVASAYGLSLGFL